MTHTSPVRSNSLNDMMHAMAGQITDRVGDPRVTVRVKPIANVGQQVESWEITVGFHQDPAPRMPKAVLFFPGEMTMGEVVFAAYPVVEALAEKAFG